VGPPATPTPPAPPPPDAAPLGEAPLYPCLGIVAGVFPDPPVPLGNAPPPPLPPGRPFTPGEEFPPEPPPVAVNPNAVDGLPFLCVPVVVGTVWYRRSTSTNSDWIWSLCYGSISK
jgi:hypothetical protein